MSFEQWMSDVDRKLGFAVGLSSEDLPDCCYRDWYKDGVSAATAARRAIRRAVA